MAEKIRELELHPKMMRQRPRDQAEVQKGIERSRSRWSTQERKFVITIRLYIGEKKSVEKLDGFGLTNCKLKRGDGRWNERAVK